MRRRNAGHDVIDLVARLASRLDEAGVEYCHWKSNEAIDRSLSGENDLDLLVSRKDAARFAAVLHELGFTTARPGSDRLLPGIIDYLGLDEPTGTVVHVQAHYQLVLGDDMTKNFRLPIEGAFLRSADHRDVLPLPSAEFEYLLFVLRMVVKHSPWDAQLDRKGRLTASERRELAYLEARIDPGVVDKMVATQLPFLDGELFADCRRTAGERIGRLGRALVARRLLRALEAHGRRAAAVDLAVRMWRRRLQRNRRRLPIRSAGAPARRRPDSGGLLIAVVGGDGSGKSTAVGMLTELLSRHFDTRSFHMGKPPRSLLSQIVKRPMQRLRPLGLFAETRLPSWATFDSFPGLAFVTWHVLTARDRHLEYRRARRAVGAGWVAVCDRFPLPGIDSMDAPRTTSLPGLERRPLARRLAAREMAYYDQMLPPDVLLVLRVRPEVAAARRRDEESDFVRRRAAALLDVDWSGTDAVVIDAEAPLESVHAQIRDAVWAAL